jgi:hypothetical protein
MGSLGKYLSILFVAILTASNMLITNTTFAQVGVTTPSTPSFGVRYEFFPHSVPPVYGVDPSTGKAVMTKEGYTVYSESAYLSIMNQPFEPYKDANGNSIQLYYNIRWKDPISNSWVYMPPSARMTQNSEGDRILVNFDFKDSSQKSGWGVLDIPMGTETDFQVQAMIGYYTSSNVFMGKTSDWTDTHSVMHASLPTDFNSPTPSVSEFSLLLILPLFIVIPLILATLLRKNTHLKTYN